MSKKSKPKLAELEAKWKRALADYQNLEKRFEKEKQQFITIAAAPLLINILPILDDLERASSHIKDSGVEIIISKLKEVLIKEGVEEIKTKDQPFDAACMECTETVSGKKDRVIETLQKGYQLKHIILRPAKVKVGKGGK